MGWTSERKETLRRMWLEGVTSRKISETLGDVSRNAVMGMVNRMGLMGSGAHNSKLAGRLHGASNAEYRAQKAASAAPETSKAPIPAFAGDASMQSPSIQEPVVADAVIVEAASEVPVIVAAEPIVAVVEIEAIPQLGTTIQVRPDEPEVVEAAPEVVKPAQDSEIVAVVKDAAPASVAIVKEVLVTDAELPEPIIQDVAPVSPIIEVSVPEAIAEKAVPEKKPAPVGAIAKEAVKPRQASNDSDILTRKSRPFAGPLGRTMPPPASRTGKAARMEVVRVATDGSRPNDWRTVVTLVEEVTGFPYDPTRKGHRAALVSIATVLSRGDPRRLLVPFLSEPQVISMMRPLAENGIIVGGKTPAAWLDPDLGDTSFMIDMMVAEGVLDPKARKQQMAEAA